MRSRTVDSQTHLGKFDENVGVWHITAAKRLHEPWKRLACSFPSQEGFNRTARVAIYTPMRRANATLDAWLKPAKPAAPTAQNNPPVPAVKPKHVDKPKETKVL